MTISHHPPEDLLADYATGALDEAEQLVVGVHVADCPRCRRFVRAIERLAGASIEAAEPVAVAADAFDAVMARIDRRPQAAPRVSEAAEHDPDDPEPGPDDHGDRQREAQQFDVVMDPQLRRRKKGRVAQAQHSSDAEHADRGAE